MVLIGCGNSHSNSESSSSAIDDTITIMKTQIDTVSVPTLAPQVDSSKSTPENIQIPEVVGGFAHDGKVKRGVFDENGLVRYYVPDSMKVGTEYNVNIRISKEKDTAKIMVSMPGGKTECIRVGSTMEVKLIDPEVGSFEITALNSQVQTIEDDGDFTSWEWTVKPLKGGNHKLKLLITIKQKDLIKDIPVFDKDIFIKSSAVYEVTNFVKINWAVLVPTFFIPFIGFIWHLFFRKKSKPSDEDDEN